MQPRRSRRCRRCRYRCCRYPPGPFRTKRSRPSRSPSSPPCPCRSTQRCCRRCRSRSRRPFPKPSNRQCPHRCLPLPFQRPPRFPSSSSRSHPGRRRHARRCPRPRHRRRGFRWEVRIADLEVGAVMIEVSAARIGPWAFMNSTDLQRCLGARGVRDRNHRSEMEGRLGLRTLPSLSSAQSSDAFRRGRLARGTDGVFDDSGFDCFAEPSAPPTVGTISDRLEARTRVPCLSADRYQPG